MTHSASIRQLAAPVAHQGDAEWMRDRVVIHKVVAALHATHPVLSDLLDELARAQGLLHGLQVRPVGERFEVALQATRLTPSAARRLVDRFAAHPQVASACIEHMLVR